MYTSSSYNGYVNFSYKHTTSTTTTRMNQRKMELTQAHDGDPAAPSTTQTR